MQSGKLNAICYNLNLSGEHLSSCQYGDRSTSVSGVMAQLLSTDLRPSVSSFCPADHLPLSEVASSQQLVIKLVFIIFGLKAPAQFFPNQIKWKMFVRQPHTKNKTEQNIKKETKNIQIITAGICKNIFNLMKLAAQIKLHYVT